jgi:hypothetical protein
MAFLTESKIAATLDIPVALPTTEIIQGDWIVVSSIKLVAPMALTYRYANLQLLASTVSTALIGSGNRVNPSLGIAFLGLYRDYTTGHPGMISALDTLSLSSIEIVYRSTSSPLYYVTPGTYYFIVANNCKSSSSGSISADTSIDLKLCATGMIRLELNKA